MATVDDKAVAIPSLVIQDLFTKGDDLQKMSVIQSLPQLLEFDYNTAVSRLMPKIQQELLSGSSELNLAASQIFRVLINKNISVNLIVPIMQGVDSKDPIVVNTWIETLVEVVCQLPELVVKKEVLNFAVSKSQINQPLYFRVTSCRVFGQISLHKCMSPFEVRKQVLPYVQSLCQDCFYEVRAAMCAELPSVAKGMNTLADVIKGNILPMLVELSSDENVSVRAAAIESVTMIIPHLSTDTVKLTIIPLIKQLCTKGTQESELMYPALAKSFGQMVANLQTQLSAADAVWFLEFYRVLCKRGLTITADDLDCDSSLGVLCRDQCAADLPKITSMVVTLIPSDLIKWNANFKELSADPFYIVRKTVAGCFHEVAEILGPEMVKIKLEFIKLLRDEAEEVLQALVPNIATILKIFLAHGILSRETVMPSTMELGRALLKCQMEVFKTNNWRLKTIYIIQLEQLPTCFPSDFIHQHFTPVMLNATLEARARPVRSQAARTLLIFLRYSAKENHRRWIRESIYNQLCYSNCSYTRHIFIKLCTHALDVFSKKYFKEFFFLPLLSLAEDHVATVRLCLINLCPTLKNMLVLPLDRTFQSRLENVMSKMEVMETDADVINTLKCKLREMRVPQVSGPEMLREEKRKIDEEEMLQKGRFFDSQTAVPGAKIKESEQGRIKEVERGAPVSRVQVLKGKREKSVVSNMSFLDQHFYIDAGISLPNKVDASTCDDADIVTEKITDAANVLRTDRRGKDQEVVISAENTNIENLSENDLKQLETSTTNITDDVKANIQKINLSKETKDEVKKRNKRYSYVFDGERNDSSKNAILKRRSLNIAPSELSRIPVCSRGKKSGEMIKTKSESLHSLDSCAKDENMVLKYKPREGFQRKEKCAEVSKIRLKDGMPKSMENECKKNIVRKAEESRVIQENSTSIETIKKDNHEESKASKKNISSGMKESNMKCAKENVIDITDNNVVKCIEEHKVEVKKNVPNNSISSAPVKRKESSSMMTPKSSNLPVFIRRDPRR